MARLCVVADTYPPKKDGVVTFLRSVLPLLRRHYDITLVAPRFSRESDAFGDVEVVLTPYLPLELANYYPALPETKLARAIRRSDVVLVNDLAPLGAAAISLASALGKPIALFCHHDEATMLTKAFKLEERRLIPERGFRAAVESIVRHYYSRVDLFFVATSRFKRKLLRLGIPENKIVFAPFAIDASRFRPGDGREMRRRYGIPEEAKVVLYLGRMSHEKNVETIIRAIPRVVEEEPSTWFVFAGGGARLEEYRSLAARVAPHAKVVFTGWVEWERAADYYAMGDVFVFPSLHEAQAFVTMEAMACELALVVSRDEGEDSYYREGENCIFVDDPLDERELAEKVLLLLRDNKLRRRLGRNARQSILSYSWEEHVERLMEGLRRIEHKRSSRRRRVRRLLLNKYLAGAMLLYWASRGKIGI
ncbi:MAG: glycosyltransferase family 4 protein [Euryarchaeota archaeon]|nr:glycosyltransferase family 4 protein [Euryarchaeota archaeon]